MNGLESRAVKQLCTGRDRREGVVNPRLEDAVETAIVSFFYVRPGWWPFGDQTTCLI